MCLLYIIVVTISNEMKKKTKKRTVETVPYSNRKIVEKCKINTSYTHKCMIAHFPGLALVPQ